MSEKNPQRDKINDPIWEEYAPTARGRNEHFEDLDLNIEQLKGKKILDIGSGLNQFANELRDESLNITSLDPFYALSEEEQKQLYRDRNYEDGDRQLGWQIDQLRRGNRASDLVAGRSEALPFQDETFDLIISHYGSPFYAEDATKIRLFFQEIKRVLKNGGEIRIYPSWIRVSNSEKNTALRKSLVDLGADGFQVESKGSALILKKISP